MRKVYYCIVLVVLIISFWAYIQKKETLYKYKNNLIWFDLIC